MDFNISVTAAALATLSIAATARAQTAPIAPAPAAAGPPAPAPAAVAAPAPIASPPAPTGAPTQAPAAPAAIAPPPPPVAAPVPAPEIGGPVIELPSERDMPSLDLPRETAIENPLRGISAASATAIGGYGELTLNAPSNAPAVVDLRRVVLFVGHNFNEHIRFYSELEVEHAVASSTDQGEFEVEQAYLDGLFTPRFNLRAGLIIMPVGIINVYHEPPTFNGVDRPQVDTLVIPSTWREPGFGIFGELATGLTYQLYMVNGFNANGFTAQTGIADGHQEAQLAAARDFGGVGRLAWEPRLATIFGVSAYGATSGNSLRSTVGSVPLLMFDADARTRYRGFTARAEIAFLFIGDAGPLNQALLAGSPDQMLAVPVASRLQGGYVEAGYDVLRLIAPSTSQDITVFARYDYANTQAEVPAGYVANPRFVRYTFIAGLVYRPIPEIGIKFDYGRHEFAAGPGFNEVATALTWMF